jgi:hypothetical protein
MPAALIKPFKEQRKLTNRQATIAAVVVALLTRIGAFALARRTVEA